MRFSLTSLVLLAGMVGFLPGPVSAEDDVLDSPVSSVDSSQLNVALKSLLVIASSDDNNASDLIGHQLQTLLPKMDDDPRLHYVHALSLLKQFRHAEAVQAMQSAAGHKLYYFPAHHFLIYEQIRQKQNDEAIESLVDLAERIGEPSQLWTSEEDRLEAARWLGRMIAYLEGPCGQPPVAKQVSQAELAMRMQVGPVYETELNRGMDEIHAEHREMQMLLLASLDTAALKKEEELKATADKEAELLAQKKSLATSAREQEAIGKEQLRDLDSQLSTMEKQYYAIQTSQERLQMSIAAVRVEIVQLPYGIQGVNGVAQFNQGSNNFSTLNSNSIFTMGLTPNQLSTALAVKQLELNSYVIEYQRNANNQSGLLAQAEKMVAARSQLLAVGENTDARNQSSLKGLSRWEQRLTKTKKKTLESTDKRTAAVRSRISLLSTYDSLSVPEELAGLQQSLNGDVIVP